MNKKVFIQEAALRLITARPDALMCEISELAVNLANCVYGTEDEEQPVEPSAPVDVNAEPIEAILEEIRKVEQEIVNASDHRVQVGGVDVRILNALKAADVKTVGDLLSLGSRNCAKLRTLGPKSVSHIGKALDNLYGIKTW